MNSPEFLEFCVAGNLEAVISLSSYDRRSYVYSTDTQGHNALHLAILNGNWKLAIYLLRELKVSPHKTTIDEESIFHSIARGLRVREASAADFAELRELNIKSWTAEKERNLQKIEERKVQHPDLEVPEHLLLKNIEAQDNDLFGNPNLTLAKYIIRRYHVVLKHHNSMGHSPAELAESLGQQDLADYYKLELTPHMIKRRLISGLNENLFREIVLCL